MLPLSLLVDILQCGLSISHHASSPVMKKSHLSLSASSPLFAVHACSSLYSGMKSLPLLLSVTPFAYVSIIRNMSLCQCAVCLSVACLTSLGKGTGKQGRARPSENDAAAALRCSGVTDDLLPYCWAT